MHDKAAYAAGFGPWTDEPDEVGATDEVTGLPTLILRGPGGHLCGYVGVPKGHPAFGKGDMDLDLEVHGGVTYAEDHAPGKASDGNWWIGFDCAHSGDLSPKWTVSRYYETYRTIDYVQSETADLANQLHALTA